MNFQPLIVGLMLLISTLSWAQITIENPHHLDIPEQRVQALHKIICHVVAEDLRVRAGETCGPVTVLLGELKEGIAADELNGAFTIYLDHWGEVRFAMADMRLAVQRLGLSQERWTRMAREIIKRVNQVTPVSAQGLREAQVPVAPSHDQDRCALNGREDKNPCASVSDSQRP